MSSGEDGPRSAHTGGAKEWNHPLELKDVGRDGGEGKESRELAGTAVESPQTKPRKESD